ncbi:MAG: alpha/beta hydrolase [Haloarculaceae archaeon]
MPRAVRDGVDIHYEVRGAGHGDREPVAFVGDAGYGAWQWSFQDRVAGPHETVVYDHRGTGRSDAPAGPYDVTTLAADLEAVLADAGLAGVHLAGAGLGGAVALAYAHEYDRARHLALFGTGPTGEAVDEAALRALHAPPGDEHACRASLEGALSPAFREANPAVVDRICGWRADDDADAAAFEAQATAWLDFEGVPLYEVTAPALVFGGVGDPVVAEAAARELAEDLPRGEFLAVEGRHLAHVESARAVTDRLLDFFEG